MDHGISILHATPTLYRYILDSGDDLRRSEVEIVVLGGEPVTANDVSLYKQRFSDDAVLVNGYGPTESTLAAQYVFRKDSEVCPGRIPVGYPIDGTTLLLGEPGTQPGSTLYGEIVIKSQYVALGYWNNPELTARAFGTDDDGNRYYKTGDVGRLLSGQALMVTGRIDHQVKIRGFRIELTEIEAVLATLPCIDQVVVLAREKADGEKYLVAFASARKGEALPETAAMRSFASQLLPEYMVPANVIVMTQWPLTASGKIDRGALQGLPIELPTTLSGRAPNAVEEKLIEIWKEVLQCAQVGLDDNFFALGGNSLHMMKLWSQIQSTFGVNLEVQDLFTAPTLEALSDQIADAQGVIGRDNDLERAVLLDSPE
jgi:acyl-CoA synthetase (AMP-forming)/AMP-acid ligase II/acyl carrier protein